MAVACTGVAARICAASPGGRRYDSTMSAVERSDISNAIWLCVSHATLIDRDCATYNQNDAHRCSNRAERDSLVTRSGRGGDSTQPTVIELFG